MKVGAWIHTQSGNGESQPTLESQIESAAQSGLTTIRSYSISYSVEAAPALQRTGMSLLGGMHVNSAGLVADWRSQVRLDELARYHELGVPLEGICVGNELREGGDEPDKKRFTARLSFGLANVLDAYRTWMAQHGFATPLTYAMEGVVLDTHGNFYEWLWPLVDACDMIGVNLYPMGSAAWFTYGAFDVSERFLHDPRARHNRLALFEVQLRRLLEQMEQAGKPLILTETGFPSAVGYRQEGKLVVPESDNQAYSAAMDEFIEIIAQANREYQGAIRCLYFYEWRDNFYHSKIWNVEQSPIHTAFGLCDHTGKPKLAIRRLVDMATAP